MMFDIVVARRNLARSPPLYLRRHSLPSECILSFGMPAR